MPPTTDPCKLPGACDGYHGSCEGCGTDLYCDDDWPSGECDSCWQYRDEFGGE
jgi:hypothetical protein